MVLCSVMNEYSCITRYLIHDVCRSNDIMLLNEMNAVALYVLSNAKKKKIPVLCCFSYCTISVKKQATKRQRERDKKRKKEKMRREREPKNN